MEILIKGKVRHATKQSTNIYVVIDYYVWGLLPEAGRHHNE